MSDSSTLASQEDMKKHKIPLAWRDNCSALVIPLNICRRKNYYLPWHCEHERHEYERCQYMDFLRRQKEMSKVKQAALNETS